MPDALQTRIRFGRNELSGAFGDIGTDFPLLVGMILIAKLDAANVLVLFGSSCCSWGSCVWACLTATSSAWSSAWRWPTC